MFKLILRRLLAMVPLLLAVAFGTFLLARVAPGDFLSEMSANPQISEETLSTLRSQYGLDRPWHAQFFAWLGRVLGGDFGYSFACHCPVGSLISGRLINTVTLATAGLALALLAAIPLGLLASHPRWRVISSALSPFTSLSLSVPSFLLALLATVLAARTGWFPIGGVGSLDAEQLSAAGRVADFLHHLALPAAVLALRQFPAYFRHLRAGMDESLSQEYIVAARARGLAESRVLVRHAFRNALNPLITMFGNSIGSLLSGAFIVEAIMSWPGLGSLAVSSLLSRDLNALMACLLLAATLMACGNLLADLLLAASDPRIRRRNAI